MEQLGDVWNIIEYAFNVTYARKKRMAAEGRYTREESNGRYIYRVLTYDVDFPGLLQEQPRHVWIFRPAGDQFPVILHAWLELYHAHRPILPSLLLRAIHPRLLAVAAFERADNLISLLSRNYSSNILCKKEGKKGRKEERRERSSSRFTEYFSSTFFRGELDFGK